MFTVEKTVEALKQRFVDSKMEPISVTMRCNGDVVHIIPCFDHTDIKTFDHIEYYLVESPSLPWLGGDDLKTVAKQLNAYRKHLAEKADDEEKLAKMRDRLQNPNGMDPDEFDELFQSYSDFYKDVYGHRPHDIQNPWKLAI